jgi:glucosyl-dolichyl phosphate glucuronosyltransferase
MAGQLKIRENLRQPENGTVGSQCQPMKISVIICTYNRCQSLAKALESAAAQRVAESVEWEALVVDNNSRDQTRSVIVDFCERYPGRFRYLFEPEPGKSAALNAAIREARGDILAFMDDDSTVTPTWLHHLTKPLYDSRWAGSGGPVLLDWPCQPPCWLPREGRYALAPLTSFNPGNEATELLEPPFGANMAFRKSVFGKYGDFRTDLGPSPSSNIPRTNEDTEFGRRLIAAGERLRYEPSAIVTHPVQIERLQKKYFLAWWFDKGRADIREHGISPGTLCCWGIPLHLFRRLAVWTVRWMIAAEPAQRFSCKLKVWGKLGAIKESYRLSHGKLGANWARSGNTIVCLTVLETANIFVS